MRHIAAEIGWPDVSLFDEISDGFKLTGVQAKSGVLKTTANHLCIVKKNCWPEENFYDRHFGERLNLSQFRIFHNLFGR